MSMSDRYDAYVSPDVILQQNQQAREKKYTEEYHFPIEYIKETLLYSYQVSLDKFFSRYVLNTANNKKEENLNRKVFKGKVEDLIFKVKVYTLLNPKTVEFIVEKISQDVMLMDFVLSLRTSFFYKMDIPSYQRESFFDKVASFCYIPKSERSMIPKNILDRISPYDKETLIDLLKENDFIIPLILINLNLSLTDIEPL